MEDSIRRRVKQTCTKCDQEKLGSEFYRSRGRKNGLQGVCKPCMREYQRSESTKVRNAQRYQDLKPSISAIIRARRNERRTLVNSYKARKGCVDCGEKDPVVLDLDHVRGEKIGNIASLLSHKIEILMAEIEKCDVRCANCHRRRTYERLNIPEGVK